LWAIVGAAAIGSAPAGAAAPPPTRPGVPAITSVQAAPLSAVVSFDKPAHDGGAPVRSDVVVCTSSNGGITATQNGARSPISVRGMTVGKSYTCKVAARNRIGVSKFSAPSTVVVPLANPLKAVPGAPTITYVKAGAQSIAVGFAPPSDHGGSVITTYRAKCASSNGGHRGNKEHLVSPVVLDGLSPGKTYTCTLQARNTGGYGPVSNRSRAIVTLRPPTITSVVGGERSVTVAFTMPTKSGTPLVVSFRATCTSGNGGAAASQSSASSPIRVRNLSIQKAYTCKVAVKNGAGTAATSAASHSVETKGA
jgi:Fibronectin type III domain